MKKNILIITIVSILAIILTIVGLVLFFNNKTSNMKLEERIKIIKEKSEAKTGEIIAVTGRLSFDKEEVFDKEYGVTLHYPIVKKVKNVSHSYGWEDEEPIYLINNCNINDMRISEEILKQTISESPIPFYTNVDYEKTGLIMMSYTDTKDLFLIQEENIGYWRLRYYSWELSTNQPYTIVGRWDGSKIMPIEELEQSVYEGIVSIEEILNIKNK